MCDPGHVWWWWPETYHPYLDTREWQFRQEVQLLLSSETRVSPLRIQNMQVTYSLDRTYVITTLLGQVSPQSELVTCGHPAVRVTWYITCLQSKLEICVHLLTDFAWYPSTDLHEID